METPFVYDPSRPDFQEQAHAIYRTLRDEHPVYHNPEAGFWALSRFQDVRAAAADPATFSSEGTDTSQGLLPMIQALDPPRHDALRQLVSKAFTPRRVAERAMRGSACAGRGSTIPEGALVRLLWGAANRDQREFADADRFDVSRSIPRHLAFGQGLHFCLGANLARLEARVAFEELLARIPQYRLCERPIWLTSIWARARAAVRVSF